MIINVCKEKLHYYEFVKPIEDIVGEKAKHYRDITKKEIEKSKYIIICGTSLKDNAYLKNIEFSSFRSVVICSRQLFPGVGGYAPHALFQALHEIEQSHHRILLSTACRCHGVLDAFRLSDKS